VLQNFPADEIAWVEKLVEAVAEAAPMLAGDELQSFMSKVALILNPPPPKPPRGEAGRREGAKEGE
jgi:PTH1 family peptidyl-tRNA hydrolase